LSRKNSNETHSYYPSRWIRVAIGVTLLVFIGITVMAIMNDLKPLYVAASVVMTALTVIALVETFVSRVDVEPHAVAVKGLLTTKRIELSQVEKVSAEGGRVALYMKTGKWRKLPEWLGANMSARRRIADRLEG
jgi:hypothetical protein